MVPVRGFGLCWVVRFLPSDRTFFFCLVVTMLDYIAEINDAFWTLALPLIPANTATINGAERSAAFKQELYRALGDDPTIMLEFRGDTLRNPYITFNPSKGNPTLRGQVNFDLAFKTKKAGTDAFTNVAQYINKAIWAAHPNLGILITGLKVVDFRFNPSSVRKGREGKANVFRVPFSTDVRILKSVLIA